MLKMGPLMPRLIFILVWLSFAKSQLIRHYNGTGNNLGNPTWGSANTPFLRIIPANYADNISQPNGADRPSARAISELLHKGKDVVVGEGGFNAFVVFFAEAIVFDTLRSTTNTSEPFPIPVPSCDSDYDAGCTGNQTLALFRQASTLVNGQRVGVNLVTSFLDANFLYGVSEEIATSIRTGNDGLLKIGNDGFPEQINGSAIVADTRIFKNPGVQTVHLLLLREHNRRARLLRAQYPSWTDEELFQTARKGVVGIWQKFVFNQYVPTLIGGPLPDYGGYKDSINPGTDSFYMGCSMRYGHSVVPTFITLIGDDGKPLAASPLVLQDHLDTSSTMRRYGIEPILRGLISQKEGEMDTLVTRELRKLTKSGPMDVPAFNIQRGRDLGLPSYNKAREYFGSEPAASFSDITRKLDVQELLSQIYAGDISKVDAWVGAIAEDNYPGSRVGPLMRASLMETFLRLRDGDRFYYLNPNSGYTASDVREIENFTFAQLVTSNTNISKFPNGYFAVAENLVVTFTNSSESKVCGDGQNQLLTLTDELKLNWTISDNFITFEATYSFEGWFAIAFGQPMVKMDANVVIPTADGVTVLDYWSNNFDPKPDVDLGGSNNVVNATQVSPKSSIPKIVRWSRPLVSNDPNDITITKDDMTLMFAYSKIDKSPTYHGPNKKSIVINFYSPCTSSAGTYDSFATGMRIAVRLLHGTTLLICFGILYPIGIYIARYRNTIDPNWLKKHERLMSFGSSEVVLAVIVGIVTRHSQFIYTHSKIGLVVFVCVIFTFIFGNLSKSPYRRIRHHHKYIRRLHITFGFTSAILGLVNCAFGVERLTVEIADAKYLQYAYYAWIFVVVFMFCYSEYRKRAMKKQKTAPENDVLKIGLTKTVPSFSWEDFNARVADGNLWILVNQCIYSVASFIDIHPGGSEIIYSHIGTDVTDYFYQTASDAETAMTGVVADSASFDHRGSVQSDLRNRKSNASRRNGPHIHSRTALVTLRSLMVGVIKDSAVQASTAEPREFYPSCIPMSHPTALSIAQFRSLSISRKSIVAGENSDPVYKFTIDFPGATDELWFIPGDYVQIQLTTSDGHTICRPYTPIKTYNKGCLDLIIKTYSNGQLTSRLKNLLPGDKVTMRGPLHRDQLMNIDNTTNGCFDNVIMFAAGSGITPIMLLIDYYHRFASRDPANGQLIPKLRLYYQSRSPKDIICYQELESMSKSAGLLEVTHVVSNADAAWKGLQGKINQSMISGWFGEFSGVVQSSVMRKNAMIVICGPDSFNQSISRALVELGVDKSLLKIL